MTERQSKFHVTNKRQRSRRRGPQPGRRRGEHVANALQSTRRRWHERSNPRKAPSPARHAEGIIEEAPRRRYEIQDEKRWRSETGNRSTVNLVALERPCVEVEKCSLVSLKRKRPTRRYSEISRSIADCAADAGRAKRASWMLEAERVAKILEELTAELHHRPRSRNRKGEQDRLNPRIYELIGTTAAVTKTSDHERRWKWTAAKIALRLQAARVRTAGRNTKFAA